VKAALPEPAYPVRGGGGSHRLRHQPASLLEGRLVTKGSGALCTSCTSCHLCTWRQLARLARLTHFARLARALGKNTGEPRDI
jgi:hypothetical protein